jgi:hypothetical protein
MSTDGIPATARLIRDSGANRTRSYTVWFFVNEQRHRYALVCGLLVSHINDLVGLASTPMA